MKEGKSTARSISDHLRQTLQLQCDDQTIKTGWNSIYGNEITSTVNVIQKLKASIPCYAFTNSNPTHKMSYTKKFPNVIQTFERIFVSSDLGHRKPEKAAFQIISQTIETKPKHILFFDDSTENIEGAKSAGLKAVHVSSPKDVVRALGEFHIL
mgnify:CR=1 FL=1